MTVQLGSNRRNKLGLSCAKLGASLDLSDFDKIFVVTLFGFGNLADEFNQYFFEGFVWYILFGIFVFVNFVL